MFPISGDDFTVPAQLVHDTRRARTSVESCLTVIVALIMISPATMFLARLNRNQFRSTRVFVVFLNGVLILLLSSSVSSLSAALRIRYHSRDNKEKEAIDIATITDKGTNHKAPASFYEVLNKALKKRRTSLEKLCPPGDPVCRRVLEEYGAMFLATRKVLPPPLCVFTREDQVTMF